MIYPKLEEYIHKLKSSTISEKIQQLRIKILIKDINQNRFRIKSILTRLNESHNFVDTLKRLAQEELI